MKREDVGGLPAWGEGCSVIVFPAVVFRSQTTAELLPHMRELLPYADESIGLALQKASTCALCPHSKYTLKSVAVSRGNYSTETGMVCSGPRECVCGQSGVPLSHECAASPIEIHSRKLQMTLPGK